MMTELDTAGKLPEATPTNPALIHVPVHLQAGSIADPNGSGERPVYLEQFEDGSGFAFNPEKPAGVVYLARHAFAVYQGLLDETHRLPTVDTLNGAIYDDFVRCGIAKPNSPQPGKPAARSQSRQFSVWFHVSNACNLSCRYCYIPKLEKAVDVKTMGAQFMKPETIERSTASLMEFCVAAGFRKLNIKFAGGEPTLDVAKLDQACETARHAARNHDVEVSFSMLTNGVFIDDAIFSVIKRHAIGISISIDGDKDSHDLVRFTIARSRRDDDPQETRKAGTWDMIERNITRLKNMGISPYILCTLSEANYTSLRELLERTKQWGVGMRLSLVRDGKTYQRQGLSGKLLDELISLYGWLGQNMPVSMPIERYAQFAEWRPGVKKQGVCGSCRSSAAIDQSGNVASCQMRLNKAWGNVHEEAFGDIFEGMTAADDNQYLTDPASRTGGCSRCYWKYTCAGGCPEHTRLVGGSTNEPSPWCDVYRGLLPHYLRSIARQTKRRIERH